MRKFLTILILSALLTPSFASAALTDNLLSYWKFDESSGAAEDSTANNLDLTNNNTTPYVSAKINNGADLEAGSSQYFSRSNGGTFDITAGTVNCWINAETLNNSSAIIDTQNPSGGASSGWYFQGRADGDMQFGFGNGTNQINAGAGSLTTATYYMVTAKWDTSRKEIYINAVSEAASETDETLTAGAANITVGRHATLAADHFDGIMDECGIWSRALSDAEITELYNGGAGLSHPFTAAAAPKVPDIITISGNWPYYNYTQGPHRFAVNTWI